MIIQWRVLNGAIAVNSFISVMNPEVSPECPFCLQRETIFHAFMYCFRLEPLFVKPKELFCRLNEHFLIETFFILGFKYFQKKTFYLSVVEYYFRTSKVGRVY